MPPNTSLNVLKKFEAAKPFTQPEAWLLFRLAAIAEAMGWSLLLGGILAKRYLLPGNDMPVQLAGRIHGTLFLIYLVAAVILYPSLGWSRKRAMIAVAASVPPYGSFLFEQWAAHKRRNTEFAAYHRCILYTNLIEQT